ncbi:methyltransferase [Streptacidiphilus fuscans]|uniref:Ribosomal RNA large subunit methyltransferase G n=1 Tax=Streptacidiphilus fuscans TaxID=2789292 RepID=A0A931B783_9ACTN|nr:methyltransferase [Streptacidiphilus fuscans]MBF9071426.1 methyltransferase [Streptacidiphilus fuscans]
MSTPSDPSAPVGPRTPVSTTADTTHLALPDGAELELRRFPEDPRDRLRAWDAADEYLLRHLADAGVRVPSAPVVLGDRWGALATALAAGPLVRPVQITDSYLAQRATEANLARNGLAVDAVRLLSSRDTPPERVDLLLVRIPKSLALLEDQLLRLAPAVHPGTVVVGTGMVTEIHTSTLQLFERILGPTRTSLAKRKARLIFCTPDAEVLAARAGGAANPWPRRYPLPPETGLLAGRTVTNHAGIFSAERLDIGTRFFLEHLPTTQGASSVVDLGCGNGILGLAAALANPDAELTFVDESFGAVASAEETFLANVPEATARRATFLAGDGAADLAPGSVDLVLNNPPFHSYQAATDATAHRMFAGARRALRTGGELWVVGNRHLGYHVRLRRIFGNCQTVAGNRKFVILRAVKNG